MNNISDEQWQEGVRLARELAIIFDTHLEGHTVSECVVALCVLFAGTTKGNDIDGKEAVEFLRAVIAINNRGEHVDQ